MVYSLMRAQKVRDFLTFPKNQRYQFFHIDILTFFTSILASAAHVLRGTIRTRVAAPMCNEVGRSDALDNPSLLTFSY
jgi:hypothetical protein